MERRLVPGNARLLKELNQYQILDAIRRHGSLARSELARLTGLTPPTVGAITAALLEDGLLVEGEGQPAASAGRRAVPLSLNPSWGVAVGVLLTIARAQVLAVDPTGGVRGRVEFPVRPGLRPDEAAAALAAAVRRVIAGTAPRRLIGVGAALHGVVDHASGVMRFAPHFGWRDVPFAAMLAKRLGTAVVADNDVRCAAMGELWFGAGRGVENFVCVRVGTGIGSGIVMDGRLFRGGRALAGEIGHFTVDLSGPPCRCGSRGCLETVASGPAIAERAGMESVEAVVQAAQAGDPRAIRALADAGTYVGVAIANLVKTLDPELVLIGGGVARAGELVLGPMRQAIAAHALDPKAAVVPVRPVALGDDAAAFGAAALVLDRFFRGRTEPAVLDWMAH
ncbi:MAG: ROK family transcriptional regulator [Symbiobacterium sp.]|uniref:ROK family transcriptional regulator n=1 Tax=Symbiobacterium sp. TaxID=1971213 RepID=UPI003463F0D6